MCRSTCFRCSFARASLIIDDAADSDFFALCKCTNDLKDIILEMRLDFSFTLRCDLSIVTYACINVIVSHANCNRTCHRDLISMASRKGHHQAVIHL